MKKLIPFLILLLVSSISLSAQSRKGKKKQRPAKTEARAETPETKSSRSQTVEQGIPANPRHNSHSFAITGESGFKTLSGFGLNGTYYVQPKIAIDLGLGLGLQLFKGGVRGRYLFLDKKFSPYVGAGVFFNPTSLPGVTTVDANGFEFEVDIDPSTFGQFVVGAEFVGTKGFVVGFNAGYAASLTGKNWSTLESIDEETEFITDFIFGNSISLGFNIGWAF